MTNKNDKCIIEEIDAESLPLYDPRVIEILELLGKGGFGEVWRAFDKRITKLVVLKFLNRYNKDKEDVIEEFMLEVSLLKKIDSIPNFNSLKVIDSLLEQSPGSQNRYVIEIESGDIDLKQILDVRNCFEIDEAAYILKTLAIEYQHLEEHGIAHCDVKPDNIILCRNEKDENFTFKISDFGISIDTENKNGEKMIHCHQMQGMTKNYAAPEVLEIEYMDFEKNKELMEKKYDPFLADVYSLGLVLLKVLCKKREQIFVSNTIPLYNIIGQMISFESPKRPRFSEIIEQCSKLNLKPPDNIKENVIEYRKLDQKKQFFGYLKETFYKYLELDIESQAKLYLDTMISVESQSLDNMIYILIAEADLDLFFHKDIKKALILYRKASDMCNDKTLAIQVTAEIRIANMFDMYKMDPKKYITEKKFSQEDLDYKRMSTVLDPAIYYWWDKLSIAGINNLGIHDCMTGRESDCITRLLSYVGKSFGVYNYNNLALAYNRLKNTENARKTFEQCMDKLKDERWKNFQNPVHITIFESNKKKFEKGDQSLEFIFLFSDCYAGKI